MRARRGFTLLEVMLATGILVIALVVLVQTQWSAAEMTFEADRILTATQLAQEKLAAVRMEVEHVGFSSSDVYDHGDFDDFGDEALDVEFEDLEDYHWEYLVGPVDLELAADLNASAQSLMGALGGGSSGGSNGAMPSAPSIPNIGGMISPEMITQALDPFVREVSVRVWWGEDTKEAEELGNEVILTTHIVNPSGNMAQKWGGASTGGGATGGNGAGAGLPGGFGGGGGMGGSVGGGSASGGSASGGRGSAGSPRSGTRGGAGGNPRANGGARGGGAVRPAGGGRR